MHLAENARSAAGGPAVRVVPAELMRLGTGFARSRLPFDTWRIIMRIEFTGRREVVAAARVAFEANVDGADVWCSVSLDALNDHFGNNGPSAHDLVGTFEANRARIENATRRVLEKNGGQSVELETGDFN
jgi:hypothetical protein